MFSYTWGTLGTAEPCSLVCNSVLHFSTDLCYKGQNSLPYRMLPVDVRYPERPSKRWNFALVTAKGAFSCMYTFCILRRPFPAPHQGGVVEAERDTVSEGHHELNDPDPSPVASAPPCTYASTRLNGRSKAA